MRLRDGFTVVEVLLALLLLSFVVMGFQAATGQIIHYAARSDRALVGVQLAEDRLELVRLDPRYEGLKSRYEGKETSLEGFDGITRTTTITRTRSTQATGLLDYHTVTVTVGGGGIREPVSRTIIIAAP